MENCKKTAGEFRPVINRNKCECKSVCVEVCPYDVLEMHVLPTESRRELSLIGKLKGLAHGWKQAVVRYPEQCMACGICVSGCPEKAITLVRSSTA